ncbi:MAG: TolC family protein [Verrucomicrobiae bacterium]|nr:TolC family protein [Verrucomicrobiae bacterium]
MEVRAPYRELVTLLIIASSLLSGCASYQPRSLEPSATLADLEGRRLDDRGLQAFFTAHEKAIDASRGRWGLSEFTLVALYFHPELATARAELELAKAGTVRAAEIPNPTLSVGPGYNSTSTGISPWILTTALDFPVEWPAKRSLRREGARREEQSAYWQLAATAWKVRSRLRQALLSLYASERMERQLQDQEDLQSEIAELLEQKRKAGEASPFEASQARLGLSQTRLSLHEAERQVAIGRVRLADAIGIPHVALEDVSIDYSAFDRDRSGIGSAEARRRALTNRADLLAALEDYAVAEENLHLEIADQYPDFNLGPGYELDQTDNKWSLGLSVELPILNRHRGRIAEAEKTRELAAARFSQLQNAVLGEIDEAVANLDGSRRKTRTAREILSEVEEAATLSDKIQQAGEIEKAELLQRKLEVSASQMALIDAEIGELEAVGQLEDALQVPTDVPLDSLLPERSSTP